MKVFSKLSLTDQKIMFSNLFIWGLENGDNPDRVEYKKQVMDFFESKEDINSYIEDLKSDINLMEDDSWTLDLTESYKRQVSFLEQLITAINEKKQR